MNAKDINRLIGHVVIEAPEKNENAELWRKEALDLLNYVQRGMSFAAGTFLRAPVVQFRSGKSIELLVTSESTQHRATMPPFRPLDRQAIFERIIDSYFNSARHLGDLRFALEWLCMNAVYSEAQLINAMTALESVINLILGEKRGEQFHLDSSDFKDLKKYLHDWISEYLATIGAESNLSNEFANKLDELNRRSLKRKLRIVINQLRVPMAGITNGMISQAIVARDHVVHRGRYYDDDRNQISLWKHVTLVRELMTRIILTRLEFNGQYESYLGGTHHAANFPPR